MGVQGLTTYMNQNQHLFFKNYYLHDTSLVIDGLSLCTQLYLLTNDFSAFGGDYDKIASCTKMFFKNLQKCNVKPYVIFDGCHENRKLRTVFIRLESKLKVLGSRLDPLKQDNSQNIFPYLLRDVFREVLIEMKIPYTICEFEADDEIAALARYLQCPVLSYDSDFFIYNVLYIPFNMLEKTPKQIWVDANMVYAMVCKLYQVKYVCERFSGLHEELLPLLAIVLGNDFVEKGLFGKFLNQLKLTEVKRKQNKQQKMIHALFSWLKNETLDSAIIKILGMLRKNQIRDVHKIIKKNVDGYHCNECKSLKYFNISTDVLIKKSEYKMPDVNEIFNSDDKNDEGHDNDSETVFNEDSTQEDDEQAQDVSNPNLDSLPDWFSDKIRKNLIPTSYLNLYAHHLHIYNPQVENVTKQDSFLSVLPIVRFAFDILTDFRHDHCSYFSRENCNYRKLFVNREYSIERPSNISYEQLTDTDLKQYFQHFLGIKLENLDFDDIKLLPSNFQLFMISVLWWISFCNVPAAHVHSLLMSYIMLEIIDEKIDSSRGHYQFNNKNAKKLEELRRKAAKHLGRDQLFLDKNKVLYDDCLIAASVLLKHFEIDRSIRMRPDSYDINKIHSFAQFQCALQQINALNTLCASPFESTVCYKSYNGTFVYNIALKLENQADPVTFIEQYIKGASTVIMFYKSICKIYNELLKKMNLSTVQSAPDWRHSRKRKRSRWSQIY